MGSSTGDPDEPVPDSSDLQILRAGSTVRTVIDRPGVLTLEDGTQLDVGPGALPVDLPLGVHRIDSDAGGPNARTRHLVVVPDQAHLPVGLHGWGVTAQLYAARSTSSWGIGDLGDLARLATWASDRGAVTVGLNPLHASSPGGPPTNSPYSPSTRRWRDPLVLDVARLVDDAGLPGATDARAEGRRLNDLDLIDRAAAWDLKQRVLRQLWHRDRDRPTPRFDAYRAEHGASLTLWGTYGAIAERHGTSWHRWPAALQHPSASAVRRFAADHHDQVAFWCWLQWLVDEQYDSSGAALLAVTDLAVGFAPDGFDAWEWQDLLATGCRIGAPPDLLGPDGQDWGLPPFVPWKLRAVAYRPIIETLRANLRHTAGLRIDHVMGLLRLFWIPPGVGAADGAFVSWPGHELVDLVAMESARAGSFVIGEDLGTVEPGVRELLRNRGLLSTRLLWFEEDPPEHWPRQAMAAVTTHDLPTIAGVWTGTDLADQRSAGVTVPADGDEAFRHRLRVTCECDDRTSVDDVIVEAHRRLAQGPSMLVTATLDDLVGAEHRPNVPGTIDEHPNWRIPLPVSLDDLPGHHLAEAVAAELRAVRP